MDEFQDTRELQYNVIANTSKQAKSADHLAKSVEEPEVN